MSTDPERALTDAAPIEPEHDEPEVIQPDLDPESFDVGAFVAGVRGTRTRVRIQPHAHLLERVQGLAEQIDAYPSDDDVPDDVADEWQQVWEKFNHTEVWVVEGRSSEWIQAWADAMRKRGVDPTREGATAAQRLKESRRLIQSQLAAQVVSPEGVTEQRVRDLFEANEPEANKLFAAMRAVNSQPVERLVPDFSERVSRLSRRG